MNLLLKQTEHEFKHAMVDLSSIRTQFRSRIKKVAFILPPDADETLFDYNVAKRNRYLNYPPYGLALLGKKLQSLGIEVQIISLQTAILRSALNATDEGDFNFSKSWAAELSDLSDCDLFAVTCMFSQGHKITSKVVDYLGTKYTQIPISMGGVHVTNMIVDSRSRDLFLTEFEACDLFFLYESDKSFPDFIHALNQSDIKNFKKIYEPKQVFLRNVGIFLDRSVPDDQSLNTIPAWDLIPPEYHSRYGKVGAFWYLKHRDPITAVVLSNRGCRAQCTFCSVRNFNGVGVRRRTVSSVIEELKLLQDVHNVEHIMWLDDDFFYDERETIKLFNEMVKNNIRITWDCSNGVIASSCTLEILDGASKSGCVGLILGMESGSPKILKEIKKPGAVKTFLKAAENLHKFPEIHSRLFLMIGFPGETFSDIKMTYEVALEMNLDWCNIAPLQPLPNTPIFDSMVAQGLIDPTISETYKNLRFNSGAYSKNSQRARESRDLLSSDFNKVFLSDPTQIPNIEEQDLIWAYMNYHLNYERLKSEKHPLKIELAQKYLSFITESIAPDNPIALYYKLLLTDRKVSSPNDFSRLSELLERSPYWKQRFNDFDLSFDNLV